MAWTEDDVANLERAISTGTRIVRNANGEMVEYQSAAEMRRLLADMKKAVAGMPRPGFVSTYPTMGRGL